jgi:hypothetical protein
MSENAANPVWYYQDFFPGPDRGTDFVKDADQNLRNILCKLLPLQY